MARHPALPGPAPTIMLAAAMLSAGIMSRGAVADTRVNDEAGQCHYIADSARQALDDGRFADARAGFTKAIEWTRQTCNVPIDNVHLWDNIRGRGEAAMRLGDHEQAASDVATLLASREARSRLGQDDLAWMTQSVETAIAQAPGRASNYAARAALTEVRAHRQGTGRAGELLLQALTDRDFQVAYAESAEEKARALAARHRLNRILGNSEAAFADITAAIDTAPRADDHWQRALLLKDRGDAASMQAALEDISAALELAPDRHWYRQLSAEIHQAMGDIGAATEDLTAALETSPAGSARDKLLEKRASLLKDSGQLKDAIADYSTLIAKHPNRMTWRVQRLLLLTELGRDEEAEAEHREIAARDRSVTRSHDFVCRLSEAFHRRHAETGDTVDTIDMRRAWNQGQVLALVPLRHVVGNQDGQTEKAWNALAQFVARARSENNPDAPGLKAVPELTGSRSDQLRQALQFINDQLITTRAAVESQSGNQAASLMMVSAFGHLAEALNRMGVSGLNTRFGDGLVRYGPDSGLPCDLWVRTMQATLSGHDRDSVMAAWADAKATFKELTGR